MISHGRNVFIMREYIGNNSQLFDVRQYTLTDGKANGTRAISVWNRRRSQLHRPSPTGALT